MKKQLAAVLCTVLCATLLLAGCGGGKEEQQETSTYEETDETETEQEEPDEPEAEPEEEEPEEEPEAEPEEEPEEEETIEEDVDSEASDSPFAFVIDNPVIYDSEGVTVTMDGNWSPDNDLMELEFTMDNNNPDNKKVSFNATISVDGFNFGSFNINGLAVGESQTQSARGYLTDYFKLKEMIDADSLPLESLSIYYVAQIGSDGEKVPGNTVFSDPTFTDAAFAQIYGDKVGEFDYSRDNDGISDATCEVYVKHTENNYTLIAMKVVTSEDVERTAYYPGIYSITINDKWCNNYLYGYGSYICNNGDMFVSIFDTPENIRKDMEIPNDVPLEAIIDTGFYDSASRENITIPVTLE